jgi:hypothetical protein
MSLSLIGKDNFEVSNEGVGRDFKKIQVKLLKKDMVDILKKYGRDSTGKKDEVILKFVEFIGKTPKLYKPTLPEPAVSKPSTSLSKIAQAEARVNRMLKKIEEREPIMGPVVSVPIPEDIPAPLSAREAAKAVTKAPPPNRPRYKHRFSDIGYNADRYTEDEILRLLADENSSTYETEEQRQIKRLTFNKIAAESRNKNPNYLGNWIVDGERYNSKTGKRFALK